ncbi:hypothetical protein AAG570_003881 [Ranatra chinensis]|uniref:Uncharacterized protein n=1 Tax=Ranatra chinensis TaxID=642074 RepID=A0ABD0Y279_9HEMI
MIPEHYKILKEMSKLKAKEHVLKERKEIVAHKMAAARNEFLRSVVHQRQKMRSAEEAKMATRDAYRGVDSLQQEVANEERDIHILQEEEQGLCQELLAAEARVADNDQDSLSTQRKRSYANYLYVPF